MTTSAGALARILVRYNIAARGQLPPDEAALKKYATEQASDLLDQAGISDPQQLFVSPRDGQPLKFVLGKDRKTLSFNGDTLVAYEQQGQDGTRWVILRTGAVLAVTEDDFASLFAK